MQRPGGRHGPHGEEKGASGAGEGTGRGCVRWVGAGRRVLLELLLTGAQGSAAPATLSGTGTHRTGTHPTTGLRMLSSRSGTSAGAQGRVRQRGPVVRHSRSGRSSHTRLRRPSVPALTAHGARWAALDLGTELSLCPSRLDRCTWASAMTPRSVEEGHCHWRFLCWPKSAPGRRESGGGAGRCQEPEQAAGRPQEAPGSRTAVGSRLGVAQPPVGCSL